MKNGRTFPRGKCGHFFTCFEDPNKNSNGATNLFGVGIRILGAMQELTERCSAWYHKIVVVRDVPWGFFDIPEKQSRKKGVKKRTPHGVLLKIFFCAGYYYIMPGAPPAGMGGMGSLMLDTTDSVVSRVDATLVAFCRALLVTLTGSRMPASTIST